MNSVKTYTLFTDHDVYLFKEGRHYKLYGKFGAHSAEKDGVKGVYFSVWAPNAKKVSVIGNFNNWNHKDHILFPRWDGSGIWEGFIEGLTWGTLYKYAIETQGGEILEKSDPYALSWEQNIQAASLVSTTWYEWNDQEWMDQRWKKNRLEAPLSVYELHLGSWVRDGEYPDRFLNYRDIAKKLVPYIKEMGFTHVEFMPVMEYPYEPSWGPFKEEYFPTAEVISENFYIPQLDRYRKIWALLPYDYHTTDKRYPVLYLQDAQNLFNEGSGYGNWEIDKKLSILAEYGRGDLIIIAIEHGSEERIKEYIFDNDHVANGSEGKKYIRFIADTLKPYVDENYRTKKDRDNTGIGGSSLGALISIYSGFLYPEVYSKLLIFSPSLWVEPNNNFPMMNFRVPFKTKIYLYGGGQEGSKMVRRIHIFEEYLKRWEEKKLFDFEFKTNINPEGTHNEFYWSQEFPRAIEWLFYDNTENPVEVKPQQRSIKN